MLHRVIYKADDSVIVMTPTDDAQLERVYHRYIATHPELQLLTYEDLDTTKLPSDRANRDKWRKKIGGGIKIDHTVVTSKEAKRADEALLIAELAKPSPDFKRAMLLQNDLRTKVYR